MAEKAQYVTLGLNGELFAAPVAVVQEILDVQPIARLPQAPANLLGMTDVRREGRPVLDLRLTLGLPPAEDTQNTRIVVLKVAMPQRTMTVGLRTDRVYEVTDERSPLLKVWSAAASTGAEAYTLAMVLHDLQGQRKDFRFAILGTDISTAVLAQGRRAVYPAEMIAPVPPHMQER